MAGIKGQNKGNKNAVGNSGGKKWDKNNREKAATLKGLALDWMMQVMNGKDEKLKKEVVLKIATSCIPTEITGEDGNPIQASIVILPTRHEKNPMETKSGPTDRCPESIAE